MIMYIHPGLGQTTSVGQCFCDLQVVDINLYVTNETSLPYHLEEPSFNYSGI